MAKDELEERRKKATLRKIERKNAGKITQPYKILEELIEEHHPELRDAKFIMLWKTGWNADKDRRLTRAKICKASEAEREVWGDCDFMILLHRELWGCKSFSEDQRRHDIDHELCHAAPEIDDASGEQRIDERDRLCWRIVKHKIETFPELIERHGLEMCTGVDGEEIIETERTAAEMAIQAEENDEKRPLLKAAEGNGSGWQGREISHLGLPDKLAEKLRKGDCDTIGKLVALMREHESWWFKRVAGIGQESAAKINDALAKFREAHPEFTDL